MTETTPSLWPRVESLLPQVEKPARYIGGELGALEPEHLPGLLSWLLVYPDTYEIGLPNQGLQILYEILNERADTVAERTYAPWFDMEALMRSSEIPLFSLETHRPARSFDFIAFNWAAELTATNILNLVDLSGVPVRAAGRSDGDPLVLVGRALRVQPRAHGGLRGRIRARRRRRGRGRDLFTGGRAQESARGPTRGQLLEPLPRSPASTSRLSTNRSSPESCLDSGPTLGCRSARNRGEADSRRPGPVALSPQRSWCH